MESPPSIALLVPCYNAASFLPRLWRSVQAQSRPFAECIIYDDASTDDTADVARSLGARVLTDTVNQGPAAARNKLIAAASTPWIHFHDADDLLHPDFVQTMSARAAQGDADVVLCQVDWREGANGDTVLRWRYDEAVYQDSRAPADMMVNIIGGIGGIYRLSSVRSIGGFRSELRYWEDLDFHLRLWKSKARFRVVDQVLSFACRHDSSTSNTNLETVWRAKSRLLSEYLADPDLAPLLATTVAKEAESIVFRQLAQNDKAGARASLDLALLAGADAPTTGSALLRLVRLLFGPWFAARLQFRVRRIATSRPRQGRSNSTPS